MPPKNNSVKKGNSSASAIKSMKLSSPRKKKNRSKKPNPSFKVYIFKVLKQIHLEVGMSNKGMSIMNSFIMDIFERIASEASMIVKINNCKTLGAREIQTAVKLVVPGELSRHAVSEGTKAMSKYSASKN